MPLDSRTASTDGWSQAQYDTDGGTTRIVGSTSNPTWYAEQLAVLPAPFRVVECDEVRAAVREIAERMLAASE